MKILAIRGSNLASLSGPFELDFCARPLSDAGLFAIVGPTGSGKSTLLDAMCLALYAQVPRLPTTGRLSDQQKLLQSTGDTSLKGMSVSDERNLVRKGCSEAYAEVDFLGQDGARYRSRWEVQAVTRGASKGTLKDYDLILSALDQGNAKISSNKTEAKKRIAELLGLNFDQFTRTVLLAQGQFTAFLKSSDKDRVELLEKITGTDFYRSVSKWVYVRASNFNQQMTDLENKLGQIQVLNPEQKTELAQQKQQLDKDLHELVEPAYQCCQGILRVAEQWSQQNQETQELEQRLPELNKQQEQAQQKVSSVILEYNQLTDQHNILRPQLHQARKLDQDIQQIQSKIQESRSEIEKVKKLQLQETEALAKTKIQQQEYSDVFLKAQQWLTSQESWSTIVPQWPAYRLKWQQAIQNQEQIDTIQLKIAELNANAAQISKELGLWAEDPLASENLLQQRVLIQKHSLQNQESIKQKTDLYNHWIQWAVIQKKIQELQGEEVDAKHLVQKLEDQFAKVQIELELMQKLSDSMDIAIDKVAEHWRANLEDGNPCPVCGSTEHPWKNNVPPEIISLIEKHQADYAQLKQNLIQLTKEKDQAHSKYAQVIALLKREMQSLELHVAPSSEALELGDRGLQDIIQRLEQHSKNLHLDLQKIETLEQNVLLYQKLQSQITPETARLESLQSQLNMWTHELHELNFEPNIQCNHLGVHQIEQWSVRCQEWNNKQSELHLAKQEIKAISDKIPDYITRIEKCEHNIQDRIVKLNHQIKLEESFKIHRQQFSHIQDVNALEIKMAEDMRQIQIKKDHTAEEFRKVSEALTKSVTKLESLQKVSQKSIEELYAYCRAIPQEWTLAVDNQWNPGQLVQNLRSHVNQIQPAILTKQSECRTKIEELSLKLRLDQSQHSDLKEYQSQLDQIILQARPWLELQDLIGSADGRKFSEFAQQFTFQRLVKQANRHMVHLNRRYRLRQIPGSLGLEVEDLDMAGELRSVHTLSGGESFLASLALALGLASLSAKNMNIGTLFIDEGFGSLSSDALQMAMGALDQLQSEGRRVGLITHVEEMKESIAVQVVLTRQGDGSSQISVVG